MSRRLFIRETIQTSAMDCGPAALRSLLDGFGIRASYDRLREACQTEIDGTSVDAIEAVAVQLGLDAAQVMLPVDHLLDERAEVLPALVVVRNPDGATHFVVVWRRHARWLQIMDSAIGRRWVPVARFRDDLYVHTMTLPAAEWRAWAGTEDFLATLRRRIARVGADSAALVSAACGDASPRSLSRLDAATRLTETLANQSVITRGREAARVLVTLATGDAPIAEDYWSAIPDGENVQTKGAILIQVMGRTAGPETPQPSPILAAALNEKPARPLAAFLHHAFAGCRHLPMIITGALAIAAAVVTGEAVLLRALFDIGRKLTNLGERMAGLTALVVLSGALLALEFSLRQKLLRLGRHLEVRLRVLFQAKLPRLEDRYLRSRPASDMADRMHNVHQLRPAPELAGQFLRAVFELLLTTVAIAWVFPPTGWAALAMAIVAIGVPLAAQPLLAERDLRWRTHVGTLTRFYLDALLGLTAIRCHNGARAVRHEQAGLLGAWARAGLDVQRLVTIVEGVQVGGTMLLAGGIVWSTVTTTANPGSLLLLVYWVLNLPALGQEAAAALWQFPMLRSTALRLLEPLSAPENPDTTTTAASSPPITVAPALAWEDVTVHAGGNVVLDRVDLAIAPGSHVGIVGVSGAGKSSLVGLLLGWLQPSAGRILIDGEPLDAARLARLREATAWVDPQVQIWNRSLFENVVYGTPGDVSFDDILGAAGLSRLVHQLPAGLQTLLGEGGGLVSGGEGQRVRLARGWARSNVRLAILDEPARGLDRAARTHLLRHARERWRDATLLCITHDVSDTQDFDRVLVVDGARLVEDGNPADLAATPTSLYRRLLDAEDSVRRELWSNPVWRRLDLAEGKLTETSRREPASGELRPAFVRQGINGGAHREQFKVSER